MSTSNDTAPNDSYLSLRKTIFIRGGWLFMAALCFYTFVQTRRAGMNNFEVTILTLSERPVVKSYTTKRSRNYVRFWVKEHPEFEFDINGKEFTSCDVGAVSKLKNGDLIFVGIHPNDLEIKLKKSQMPPFWMKHFGWKRISVYQLAHDGREFINRNRAADLIQGEKHLTWVLPIIGVGLLVFVFGKYAIQK